MTGRTAALAVALVCLCGACVVSGYLFGRMRAAETVAVAKGDARTCVDTATQQTATLDAIAERAAAQLRDHKTYLDTADKSLAERTAQAGKLIAAGDLSSNQIKELARADPDCAALTLLPLCPAVTERLWRFQTPDGAEPAEPD